MDPSATSRTLRTARRHPRRTGVACLATIAAASGAPDVALAKGSVHRSDAPVVGMQDRWIDSCDNNEHLDHGRAPLPDYTARPQEFADGSTWSNLHLSTARITVPWDIAWHHDRTNHVRQANAILATEQSCLNDWLAVAAEHHVTPEVQLKPDYNHLNARGTEIMAPTSGEYRAAMRSFMRTYVCRNRHGALSGSCRLPAPEAGGAYPAGTPRRMANVRIIAPWGEPDFASTSRAGVERLPQDFHMPKGRRLLSDAGCNSNTSTCGPALAAQMWRTVHADCRPCTDIAGTFSGDGGLEPFSSPSVSRTYLGEYARALGEARPNVWALDPYPDTSRFEWTCWHRNPPYGKSTKGHSHARDCATAPGQNSGAQTITGRFASGLRSLGYGSRTAIWLGEVSVFFRDMYNPRTIGGKTVHPTYGWDVEKQAAQYLLGTLGRAGGVTSPGEPQVRRLYYMHYADGKGFPDWGLVLVNPKSGHETRTPAYQAFARRALPRGNQLG